MRQNARSSEELISNFWGSYVHVADGPTGVVILRDPSGGLPCYQVAGTGFAAFASDAPLLVSAGLLRPSVDLEVVGQTLYFSQLPRVETAIAGIKQLLPRSEEHTSELQSLMRISYAVFCLKKNKTT